MLKGHGKGKKQCIFKTISNSDWKYNIRLGREAMKPYTTNKGADFGAGDVAQFVKMICLACTMYWCLHVFYLWHHIKPGLSTQEEIEVGTSKLQSHSQLHKE